MKSRGLGFQARLSLACLGMAHVRYGVKDTGHPSDFRRWRRSAVGRSDLSLSLSLGWVHLGAVEFCSVWHRRAARQERSKHVRI